MTEIQSPSEGQTQSNVSDKSWVMQLELAIDSASEKWHPSLWEPSEEVCIFRVPKSIMSSKKNAYVPLVVSLGPYHHKIKPILTAMDQYKLEAVKSVLRRLEIEAKTLIQEIEKLDTKIRKCYDEEIYWNKETLSWMFAMDACFILEFFRNYSPGNTVQWDILNDIMKLENQIPFFVLKAVLKLEIESDEEVTSQLTLLLDGKFSRHPFCSTPSDYALPLNDLKGYREKAPKHLLDLQRMMVEDLSSATAVADNSKSEILALPCCGQRRSCINILNRLWPAYSNDDFTLSAELLHKAGIKFQAGQIGFESGKFSFPQIVVDDNTETVLRNLMAYEECQRCSWSQRVTVISNFVCFLDKLIESETDVSILKEEKIIKSYLGSDKEVADIFNNLGKGISVDLDENFNFLLAAQEARKHYYSPWKRPIRRIKEAYCSKPLYWVSILAGTAILAMTAVQMAYAIKNG